MLEHSSRAARRRMIADKNLQLDHAWTYLCGTLYEMPAEKPTDQLIADADQAVLHAQSVRKAHARKSKRGSRQRETDIRIASERIKTAMRPIRRRIARLPYGISSGPSDDLREASQRLQRERRKLWKMKNK